MVSPKLKGKPSEAWKLKLSLNKEIFEEFKIIESNEINLNELKYILKVQAH